MCERALTHRLILHAQDRLISYGTFTHTLRCAAIVQRIATLAQRSAELAIAQRCTIATLSLAQRSAATTISTIAAQRSVCVNGPLEIKFR